MGICAVCKGARSEHFDENGAKITVHEYTEVPGNLAGAPINDPKKDKDKDRKGENVQLSRLVEVLAEKGLFTPAEVIYIATGTRLEVKTDGNGS